MEQFDEREKRPLAQRVFTSVLRVILILGLFFYVFYHLTGGFSTELETETVNTYSQQITLALDGVIVQNEIAVENTSGGVVSYRYENGTRVNKNAKVAVVYGSGDDAETVARVAEIDKTIDFLSDIGIDKELSTSDGFTAGKKISTLLLESSDGISRGNYGTVAENNKALLESHLLRNAALDGEKDGVKAALLRLENERARLAQSLSGVTNEIRAKEAGYFYDYSDGGEKVFDYGKITSLSPEEYRLGREKLAVSSSNAAGKIVTVPKWYFVCTLAKSESAMLSEGKSYDLLFRMSDMSVKMKLEKKNSTGEETLLVFSAKEMQSGFDFSREQKATVTADTVSGYRVPSSALRMVDGTVGVYIRSGNTIKFRVCEVIYESGAYALINTETEGVTLYASDEDEENDLYCKGLMLYDNVIVGGAKELYPDRIVN